MTTVAQDYANYMQSMMDGDWQASLLIEQRHGLDGYPPEIVTLWLHSEMENPGSGNAAIDEHLWTK